MSVVCAICDKAIEKRREMLIKWNGMFKMTPTHYRCMARDVIDSGLHWNRIEVSALHSGILKLSTIVILVISFSFFSVGASEGNAELIVKSLAIMLIFLYIFAMMLLAYLRFERKVPE